MSDANDLSYIRDHLYYKSEKLWWLTFSMALGIQIFSLIAIWINHTVLLSIVGLIALTIPIAIAWIREQAGGISGKADKCRRLILYSDGLGEPISKEDLAILRTWAIGDRTRKPSFIPPYYASMLPPGPNRLADIMTESAFFTEYLADKVVTRLSIVLGLSAIIVIVMLYASATIFTDQKSITNIMAPIAKSAASVIALLISGDIALLDKKYHALRGAACNAVSRCARMRNDSGATVQEVLQAVEDYNVILAKSPPIPRYMYEKYKQELNNAYRASHWWNVREVEQNES